MRMPFVLGSTAVGSFPAIQISRPRRRLVDQALHKSPRRRRLRRAAKYVTVTPNQSTKLGQISVRGSLWRTRYQQGVWPPCGNTECTTHYAVGGSNRNSVLPSLCCTAK